MPVQLCLEVSVCIRDAIGGLFTLCGGVHPVAKLQFDQL